ncbi:MAG: dihydrolipoamide acetyltransferase [unclassified Hahellaceae]|nr:dihydrolipoamide acetyltransferase [Hahellaceae bacterium]|tara:strand:+ start:11339 stop:12769 length:1431 start_codon:yes stop_codon:yes gene_type:complete
MNTESIRVPDLGGAAEVEIIEISVKAGDMIDAEDAILVLESDKATMELPSPRAGKIVELTVSVGDKVSEGDVIGSMEAGDADQADEAADDGEAKNGKSQGEDATASGSGEAAAKSEAQPSAESGAQSSPSTESKAEAESKPGGKAEAHAAPVNTESNARHAPAAAASADQEAGSAQVHAGPAVRKLARELGVELNRVKGSGPKNRITKDDLQGYIKQQLQAAQGGAASGGGGALPAVKLPDFSQFGEVERSAMSRLQNLTAESMQRSWLNVPHVTQFDEADITDLEDFRKAQKAAGEAKGLKLTPLPFILKACAYALKAQPAFNVSLDMDRREVVQKRYVHIGLAVDTPAGLVVPVIRDVDRKGIWELAREAQELAAKARDKQLKPAEMQGGCFTITSLGGIGGTAFTPIVNTPEVAILGVSRAAMKPVWDGKAFLPRLMLPLSLSYDHRAVNGADAAKFTSLLSRLLGDLRELML